MAPSLLLLLLPAATTLAGFVPAAHFSPTDLTPSAAFGSALSACASFVAVGAQNNNDTRGSLYVFNCGLAGNCSQTAKLEPVDGQPGNGLGRYVALTPNLVVGTAWGAYGNTGEAFIWSCASPGVGCVEGEPLYAPEGAVTESFGASIAAYGSLVVVGATHFAVINGTENATSPGVAYLFNCSDARACTRGAVLRASNGFVGDHFGWSSAVDTLGESYLVVIGAWGVPKTDTGTVYAYLCSSALTCAPEVRLSDPTGVPFSYFGASVAVSGRRVCVGSWGANGARGRAHVFDCALQQSSDGSLGCTLRATLNPPTGPPGAAPDYFGFAVAVSGPALAVSTFSPGDPTRRGVYMYDCARDGDPAVGCVATGSTLGPLVPGGDVLSPSVALTPSLAVFGAPDATAGAGVAYVFECAPGMFGPLCASACPDCSGNGVCAAGRTGDGKCVCDDNWFGDACSYSTLVAILCPVGACAALALCAYFVRRRATASAGRQGGRGEQSKLLGSSGSASMLDARTVHVYE